MARYPCFVLTVFGYCLCVSVLPFQNAYLAGMGDDSMLALYPTVMYSVKTFCVVCQGGSGVGDDLGRHLRRDSEAIL